MNGREFYGKFKSWSQSTAERYKGVVGSTVADIISSPQGAYHDFNQWYFPDSEAGVIPGNPPFFVKDLEQKVPEGLDLPVFIGKFQALNTVQMWKTLLEKAEGGDVIRLMGVDSSSSAAGIIVDNNQDLFDATLVLTGAGVVFGDQLSEVTTDFDKTYHSYQGVQQVMSEFQGAVQSADELRKRLLVVLGTTQNGAGTLITGVEPFQRQCPAGEITGAIFTAFGNYLEHDETWKQFKGDIYT